MLIELAKFIHKLHRSKRLGKFKIEASKRFANFTTDQSENDHPHWIHSKEN